MLSEYVIDCDITLGSGLGSTGRDGPNGPIDIFGIVRTSRALIGSLPENLIILQRGPLCRYSEKCKGTKAQRHKGRTDSRAASSTLTGTDCKGEIDVHDLLEGQTGDQSCSRP